MKQTIAFIMAIAVLTCTLSMTTFAATVNYPVASVSSNAYVANDDGDLYLDKTASKVNYGKTVYFPLLSSASSAVSEKQTAFDKAKKEYDDAYNLYENNYKPNLIDYNQKKVSADNAANELKNFNYATELAAIEYKITQVEEALRKANEELQAAILVYEESLRVFKEKNQAWVDTGSPPTGSIKEAKDQAETKMQTDEGIRNQKQQLVDQKTTDLNNAKEEKTKLGTKKTTLETKQKETANLLAAAETTLKNATQKTAIDLAIQAVKDAETSMNNKKLAKEAAEKALSDAIEANKYQFVYETNAGDNVKVTPKWEEGGGYVDHVEVIRKRVKSDIKGATSSSMQLIYFLAITIEKASTTQSRDLLGTVTLKKSGSDGFTIKANIGIELGYSNASGSGGEIGKTGRTFKDGDGFDAEDDFEFSFEADGKSKFIVDTSGQGKIVLSFNRDYDSKIERKYPDAILEFFNGNYASFNRVGTLYLGSKIDDAYVYEISKTGELSRVSAKYDDYEEAYKISTRTLGRYVISDKKLAISSSSSSSSGGSGSGTGTGTGTGTGGTGTTVVPVAPSTPSYTYTPPTTPAASSSTAPPAQSSSSEEPEEEEESESEPEELEDEDDIVDVVIDDEDAEGPEEKSGIPVWVWVLIIVGLAAIPIGIGVVYYLHSRPLRRDFFNAEEDEYDDDDDED